MSVVPLRWQGKTRLEQVRSLLKQRAEDWLHAWAVDPARIGSEMSSQPGEEGSLRWIEARGSAGTMAMSMPPDTLEKLGCRLAGAAAPDADGLASGIGERGLRDFLQMLVGGGAKDLSTASVIAPTFPLEARQGTASFAWMLADLRLGLFLDSRLCDALAPRQQAATERLVGRADAVLPEQVVLHAVLDLGSARLEQTVDLKPGDVIRTDVALDALVRLQAGSGDGVVATGRIAVAEGQRAFRCQHLSNTKEKHG
ncbi:MAG TPA: hypothetical protein VGH80_13085 [Xanthomonadaceae bacterium]|jgi:hypothetical protein